MNKILGLAILVIVFLVPNVVLATNCGSGSGTCFVVAAGGNSNATSTWTDTTGGATCTCVPIAGDAVILDSAAGQLTISAAFPVGTFDASGTGGNGSPYAGTLTHNAFTMTVSGNLFKLVAGMTYSPGSSSRIVAFTSTSGTVLITTAGKTMGGVTLNGTGGTFQLQDALAYLTGGTITLTAGTFDANGQNVTGGFFSSSNSNTRVIAPGSGAWVLNATGGSPWDTSTSTNLSVSANTATLTFSSSATTSRLFATGGINFNGWAVTVVNSGSIPAQFSVTGAGRVGSLALTAPLRVLFPAAATFTIDNAFTWAGSSSSSALNLSTSDTNGSAATISVGTGSPTINWAAIQGLTFTGGATFTASNSFDLKGNTGITISGPSGGGGGKIIGG